MPGRWFEEFREGDRIEHAGTHTITQEDNAAFCRMTRNEQPLHVDSEAAKAGPFGKLLVNGLLTFSLGVGVSVRDLTEGTLIANLGYSEIVHPAPVFPGDSVRVWTQVLSTRTTSKPGRGLVSVQTHVENQDGVEVCRFQRAILVRMRDEPEAAA